MSRYNPELIELIESILAKNLLSSEEATFLESKTLETILNADDDPAFEDLMLMLASYNPNGGEYLYNQQQVLDECRRVLLLIK